MAATCARCSGWPTISGGATSGAGANRVRLTQKKAPPTRRAVPPHPDLHKKLCKIFEPKTSIDDVFKGYDITFVTNEHGEPITLFFGKRRPDGIIAGERYARTIKRRPGSPEVKSSHWDLRGKTLR